MGELITLVTKTGADKVLDAGDQAKKEYDGLRREKEELKIKLEREIQYLKEERIKNLNDLQVANEKIVKLEGDFAAFRVKSLGELQEALEDCKIIMADVKAFKDAQAEVPKDPPPP